MESDVTKTKIGTGGQHWNEKKTTNMRGRWGVRGGPGGSGEKKKKGAEKGEKGMHRAQTRPQKKVDFKTGAKKWGKRSVHHYRLPLNNNTGVFGGGGLRWATWGTAITFCKYMETT